MKDKISRLGVKAGKTAIKYTVKGVRYTGKTIYEHRNEILDVSTGVVKGIGDVCLNLYGAAKTEDDFEYQVNRIMEQSREFESLSKVKAAAICDKDVLLETIGVSTSTVLSYFASYSIPDDVKKAYEMAYPGLSKNLSLEDLIKHTDANGLRGYVSAIKGKLFEIQYADYLNSDGHLPDSYTAVLAESATNPGWDIEVLDSEGNVDQVLQLKATESMNYIKEALERYPDIDVVSTEEVYSQLAMHGMAEHVINSGISNDEITSVVEASLSQAPLDMHWGPPLIPLLIIGYSLYKGKENITSAKLEDCGDRYVKSYVAYLVGGAFATMTNLWFVGLVAAFGSRMLLANGKVKYRRYRDLQDVIENNEIVLTRMRSALN